MGRSQPQADKIPALALTAVRHADAPVPIGNSPSFLDSMRMAERVGERPRTTVLVFGETGSGKELLARRIHDCGDRAHEPFVALNCSAIPEALLESELFGHVQGAFTDARHHKVGLIEAAGGGTLFLDEIGDLPLSLQPKLLRVIEERQYRRIGSVQEFPVRCRIVAATNMDLEQAVARGRFRADVFYRLDVFRIDLPPLRERREDIVPLAAHFLQQVARESGVQVPRLDESAREALRRHSWPGNVRELRNVIERASVLTSGGVIRESDLRLRPHDRQVPLSPTGSMPNAIAIPADGKSLAEIEREAIHLTMVITAGNVSAASRILGVSRPTLLRKMRASGVDRRSLLASS